MKFSSRFHWDLRPNRLTQALEEKRRAGAEILDLTESNPTRAGFEYPEEIVRALDDPRMLEYRPTPAGLREAREAVAGYYAARGRCVDPARILLTASTSEAYAYLFKLLCDPGDSVLVPRPSYPLFEFLAGMESVKVRQYSLVYHGSWSIDVEQMQVGDARAIVLVNPNNPTGSFVKRAEMEALARLGIPLISDEVFADYALRDQGVARRPGGPPHIVAEDCKDSLAFSISGLSKVVGLPQMKLGWIVVSEGAREAIEKLEWIADTYLSVSTPVQCAAAKLLAAGQTVRDQIRKRTAANLAFAREALHGSAANILDVEGGWYITIQVPRIRSEEEWALELLSNCNVLVQPGFFFDFETEAYLVVSLLTAAQAFEEGMRRVTEAVSRA